MLTHISNHHVVHFKYLTILSVNYTSIKLENKRNKEKWLNFILLEFVDV